MLIIIKKRKRERESSILNKYITNNIYIYKYVYIYKYITNNIYIYIYICIYIYKFVYRFYNNTYTVKMLLKCTKIIKYFFVVI